MADSAIFQVPGAQILFKLLSTASEMHAEGLQKYQHTHAKNNLSFKGLLTKLATKVSVEEITELAKSQGKSTIQFTGLGEMSMEKLAAVEAILGGNMATFDTKKEHEKTIQDAKNRAKKIFGDARERHDAKKKEKQKGTLCTYIYYQASITIQDKQTGPILVEYTRKSRTE